MMMSTPRAKSAKTKYVKPFDSHVERKEDNAGSSSSSGDSLSISTTSIKKHLEHAQFGLDKFKEQIETLRRENKRLKRELESSQKPPSQAKRAKSRAVASDAEDDDDDMDLQEMQIKGLKEQVRDLEDMNQKLKKETLRQQKRIKKRFQKFQRKELQEEVKDLTHKLTGDDEEEMDPEYRMRKLLRRFSDLMLFTTLEDDQKCPICLDELQTKKCSALECEHIVCNDCLPRMPGGDDEMVRCAECRKLTLRDNIEVIQMTEGERWDQLLHVAQAWAAFDVRGEAETSEEEAEENFINDETGTSDVSSEANQDKGEEEDHVASQEASPSLDDDAATPPPSSSKSFFDSPTKEKRKRMEQLAEERSNKRRK